MEALTKKGGIVYQTKVKPGESKAQVMGTVTEAVEGDRFRVQLDSGQEILAEVSGRMQYYIRVLPGDRVSVEFPLHDPTQGKILYRYRR
jgi:translation initiation factor IF-1